MLLLQQILRWDVTLRLASLATIASLLRTASAQTYSNCNPTQGTCAADTALGTSKSYDFTKGASSDWTATGAPTYNSNGASFTVAKSGDAPTITSKWYIMFGSYTVTMKAAPGTGIVSSIVLQSDDLDEIDWEFLGSRDAEVQSNYFGKGQTTTSDRSAVLSVANTQEQFHTYTVQWTASQIVWQIDGTTKRTLSSAAADGQYPQTPMQLKIGAWAGGDPSNAAGTIAWAGGDTSYAAGPYSMLVQSVSVEDFSTGTSYSYDGTAGTWQSIRSNGGTIGSSGGSSVDTASPVVTSVASGDVPFDGTHRSASSGTASTPNAGGWSLSTLQSSSTAATSLPGLPSGWSVSESGKVVPASSAGVVSMRPLSIVSQSMVRERKLMDSQSISPSLSSLSSSWRSGSAHCSSGLESGSGSGSQSQAALTTLQTYDQQGFLTTVVLPVGYSPRYDDRGFLVTATVDRSTATAGTTTAGIGQS